MSFAFGSISLTSFGRIAARSLEPSIELHGLLAPLLFAGAVLLLEWGIVARRAIVQQTALATTAAIV